MTTHICRDFMLNDTRANRELQEENNEKQVKSEWEIAIN